MTNIYDIGDRIAINTSTVFQDTNGAAFDPDTVTFKVKDPAGTTTSYVYGTAVNVAKNGVGDYTCTIDVDQAGLWHYRIEGEQTNGDNRGADEGSFTVKNSNV